MRQHSVELAVAIEEAGWLQLYLTMLPDEREFDWLPASFARLLPAALARNSLSRIPKSRVRVLNGPLLLAKAARNAGRSGPRLELAAWTIFDRWVAKQVRRSRPSVVVGFEMCCVDTLKAARDVGATGVLDAAAYHYENQDAVLGLDRSQLPPAEVALRRRKQAEIDLADLIVCCSAVAGDSYLRGGAEAEKIQVNPLGCNTATFAPPVPDRRSGPPKFLFAGTASRHKGADILDKAFAALLGEYPGAELHVAGDRQSAREFFRALPHNRCSTGSSPSKSLPASTRAWTA